MVHSSTILYAFGSADRWFTSTVSFYIATNMVVSFYLFSVLKVFVVAVPELKKDMSSLSKIRSIPCFSLKINVLMSAMLLFGVPGTVMYLSNTIIDYTVPESGGVFKHLLFSDAIAMIIAWRVMFAYFGSKKFSPSQKVVRLVKCYRKKTILLGFFGFLFATSGYIMRNEILGFLGNSCERCYSLACTREYFFLFAISGIVVTIVAKISVANFKSDGILSLSGKVLSSIYKWFLRHFSTAYDFAGKIIAKFTADSKTFTTLLLRKSVVGVFANMYGVDVVLCLMGILFTIMVVYCVR
jgi:hypothetical protein